MCLLLCVTINEPVLFPTISRIKMKAGPEFLIFSKFSSNTVKNYIELIIIFHLKVFGAPEINFACPQ